MHTHRCKCRAVPMVLNGSLEKIVHWMASEEDKEVQDGVIEAGGDKRGVE